MRRRFDALDDASADPLAARKASHDALRSLLRRLAVLHGVDHGQRRTTAYSGAQGVGVRHTALDPWHAPSTCRTDALAHEADEPLDVTLRAVLTERDTLVEPKCSRRVIQLRRAVVTQREATRARTSPRDAANVTHGEGRGSLCDRETA